MKFRLLAIALLAASLGLAATTFTRAADAPADAPKADKKALKNADKAAAKPLKLDGEIGKLDLTDTQKADIIKLRTDARAEIAQLQAEIRKLQDEEKAKEVALLTPDQQTRLIALEEAARKAAEEKKAANAAANPKPAKDAPKDAPKAPKDGTDPKLPLIPRDRPHHAPKLVLHPVDPDAPLTPTLPR